MPIIQRGRSDENTFGLCKFFNVILITILLILIGSPGQAAAAIIDNRDALIKKAKDKGQVRVIVHFDVSDIDALTVDSVSNRAAVPGNTAPPRASQADNALSEGIKKAAEKFLSRLSDSTYKINAKPKFIPFIGLSVNEKALRDLEGFAEVIAITEDLPVPLPDPPEPPADLPTVTPQSAGADFSVGAESSWDSGFTGAGWFVAILDTGIRSSHEMFAGKTIVEHCFSTTDPISGAVSACPHGQEEADGPGSAAHVSSNYAAHGHGTHVAGIAAGDGPNAKGVAVDADIIAVQIFSRFENSIYCGGGNCVMSFISDNVRALDWVFEMRHTYPIAAVNMSLGAGYYSDFCDSDPRKAAIDNLKSAGIAVSIAAGNSYYCDGVEAPACISSSVSVGAYDGNEMLASFSNWNDNGMVDLLAPGVIVFSAVPSGDADYEAWNGTSMAAPFVTGAWAILKQKRPEGSVDELLAAMQATAGAIDISCNQQAVDRAIRIDGALLDLNRPPSASAGNDRTVTEGSQVTLDGLNSSDPDVNDMLVFEWHGPADIPLSDSNAVEPAFAAPDVGAGGRVLEFQLIVSDNHNSVGSDTVSIHVSDPPPSIDAGGNQTVDEGVTVTLDGSASKDMGISSGGLSFSWTQVAGTPVVLADPNGAKAAFTAPPVGPGGDVLSFELAVTDNAAQTATAECSVMVRNINQAPTAEAGNNQQVNEETIVTLDGSASTDPDGIQDIVAYQWVQTGGAWVVLHNPAQPVASFTAPSVGAAGAVLAFELTVTDDRGLSTTDTCSVTIQNVNKAPSADAGNDQQALEGTVVFLDGSGSTDPDGTSDIVAYHWTQTSGVEVVLNDPAAAATTFSAPEVGQNDIVLDFELAVTDHAGITRTDGCTITVKNVNQAPIAATGPNQTLTEGATVMLSGIGSTDPDPGDTLTYKWTQINGTPIVTLSDPKSAEPVFVCSLGSGSDRTTLTFELKVIDPDGLFDTEEVTVAVVENNISGFPEPAVTTDTPGGAVGVVAEDDSRLVKLEVVDPSHLPPAPEKAKNFPYDMFDLAVKVPSPGMEAKLTIYFESPLPDNIVWMKYNPDTGWEDYTTHVEFKTNNTMAIIRLVDGGIGDDDGIANGIIIDPSGPGSSDSLDTPAVDSSAGGGGCFISTTIRD